MNLIKFIKNILCLTILFYVIQGANLNAQTENKKVGKRRLKNIGVQLYTVRKELEKDFEGTLRRIAKIGYDEVEFAGLFGKDPNYVRKFVNKLGMKIISSHIDWKKLKDNPKEAINETKSLGAKYMVLAWFPSEERKTLEQWKDWAKFINKVAKMSHQRGIRFLYHNHEFEFKEINGVKPFDLLLKNIDRRYVSFEVDFYWLQLGGREAKELFKEYPKGFPLSHVKDMSKTTKSMVDVGDGRIDFAALFAQSGDSGMKHYFVEHDETEDSFKTLERSLNYLRELHF